jgi:integrase/recombinase XerC
VIAAWLEAGAHSPQSLERMGEVAVRFARRLTATGCHDWNEVDEQDCAEFVEARVAGSMPSVATLHFRRTTIRTIFRTLRDLGIVAGEPTVDLVLPPRTVGGTRPLSDDELTLLRTAALTTGRDRGRNATILALAEATAITSEIALVHIDDLDNPSDPTALSLPGNRRAEPRTGHLTDWGQGVIARRVRALCDEPEGDGRLAFTGTTGPEEISGQASVCNALGVLLAAVGLNLEPDVRPASVRYWAGRTLYDSGAPITDVAIALGARSLDAAATAIGLDWQAHR